MTSEANKRPRQEPEEDRVLRAELLYLEAGLDEASPEEAADLYRGESHDLIEASRLRLARAARSAGRRVGLGALARQAHRGEDLDALLRGQRRELRMEGIGLPGGAQVDLLLERGEGDTLKIAVTGGLDEGELTLCLGDDERGRALAKGAFRPGARLRISEFERSASGLPLIELSYRPESARGAAPKEPGAPGLLRLAASALEALERLLSSDGKLRLEFEAANPGRARVSRLEAGAWGKLSEARMELRAAGLVFVVEVDAEGCVDFQEDQLEALAACEEEGRPFEGELL